MKFRSILFAAAATILAGAAHAQYVMVQPMLYHGPVISYRDHVAAQESGRRARQQGQKPPKAQNDTVEATPPRAEVAPPADATPMHYRPDAARRRSNLAQFVERTRAVDPAGARNLETLFAQGDIIEAIATELRKKDLRVDNVADAYAVWWITAWLGTRGRTDDVSPATLNAVREQAAAALNRAPGFTGAGDAAKQEMAESLLIQAALIEAAVEQSKGAPEKLREVGAAVNQGAKQMGLDMMTLNLNEKGFLPL